MQTYTGGASYIRQINDLHIQGQCCGDITCYIIQALKGSGSHWILCDHHAEIQNIVWIESCMFILHWAYELCNPSSAQHGYSNCVDEKTTAQRVYSVYWEFGGFPGGWDGKESACNAEDLGSTSGLGRSPGERNSYPLQDSCLENSKDTGAWQATIHGVTELDVTEQLAHTHTHTHTQGFIKVKKVKFEASLVYLWPKFTLFLVSQRSIPSPWTVLESRGRTMQVNLF